MQQAVLDAPMFISRWRWNLNRSLLVLRFRGGRRNPPPIQRMEADDLMAAMFPQAAACQDNRVGPIEIPDHVIVRQTIDDTLHEGARRRRAARVARAHRVGRGARAHRRHHRTVGARARDPHRAAVRVPRRRRSAEPAHERGAAPPRSLGRPGGDRPPRPRRDRAVHAEITPQPESSDDLHDLLCSLVLIPPAPGMAGAVARARRVGPRPRGRHRRPRSLVRDQLVADAERLESNTGDDVAIAVVRGHLELAGITTIAALGRTRRAPAEPGRDRARRARARGLRAAGQLHARRRRRAVGVAPAARAHALVLAEAPAQRGRTRHRAGLHALPSALAAPRARHPARGSRRAGQGHQRLQGWEAAAAAWEPELISRRLRGYNDAALDRLCHEGEIGWLRLTPQPRDINAPAGAPNKATPISVVFRADLGWLLDAARDRTDPDEPVTGATAEVIEHLRTHGACFATELGQATGRLREDIERASGTACRAACSPPTASARSAARSTAGRDRNRRAFRGFRVAAGPGRRRGPLVAGARPCRPKADRPRRARRSGRRAAAQPLGRRLPRPRDRANRSASRGARCSGRYAGSKTAGSCRAVASSAASAASSSRCRPRPNSSHT